MISRRTEPSTVDTEVILGREKGMGKHKHPSGNTGGAKRPT